MSFAGSLDYLFTELGSVYAEVKVSMEKMHTSCHFITQMHH